VKEDSSLLWGGDKLMDKLNIIYDTFIEGLDQDKENKELLSILKEHSTSSDDAKILYEQALLAYVLFQEKKTASRLPALMEKFRASYFKQAITTTTTESIWDYLNQLLTANKLVWSEALRRIGVSPQLAHQIKSGQSNISRFKPEKLAALLKLLDVDFERVLGLIKEQLYIEYSSPYGNVIHFRKTNQQPLPKEHPPFPHSITDTNNEIETYISSLKKHFNG
jgi:transcriptional regulator with XRE-family HTH domain